MYVQAISKYAPHPNAAKLWMEHLYSDEGQLIWLKGYCNPIRYEDMVARNVIPADLAAKLPDTTGAVLPTLTRSRPRPRPSPRLADHRRRDRQVVPSPTGPTDVRTDR